MVLLRSAKDEKKNVCISMTLFESDKDAKNVSIR